MTKDDSVLSPGTRAGEAVRVDDPWAEARRMIDGWQGGINIAHEALDRHVEAGYGGQLAIRWLGKSGERRDLTYSDLQDAANRFAQVLGHHGLKPGDSVFAMAGRVPELYATALGTLKAGMIFTPLFSAFGPEPCAPAWRSAAQPRWSRPKASTAARSRPGPTRSTRLKLILIIGDTAPEGCVALGPAMDAASPRFETVATAPRRPRADPLHLGHHG
jgi:acetyl-CoA synthetase